MIHTDHASRIHDLFRARNRKPLWMIALRWLVVTSALACFANVWCLSLLGIAYCSLIEQVSETEGEYIAICEGLVGGRHCIAEIPLPDTDKEINRNVSCQFNAFITFDDGRFGVVDIDWRYAKQVGGWAGHRAGSYEPFHLKGSWSGDKYTFRGLAKWANRYAENRQKKLQQPVEEIVKLIRIGTLKSHRVVRDRSFYGLSSAETILVPRLESHIPGAESLNRRFAQILTDECRKRTSPAEYVKFIHTIVEDKIKLIDFWERLGWRNRDRKILHIDRPHETEIRFNRIKHFRLIHWQSSFASIERDVDYIVESRDVHRTRQWWRLPDGMTRCPIVDDPEDYRVHPTQSFLVTSDGRTRLTEFTDFFRNDPTELKPLISQGQHYHDWARQEWVRINLGDLHPNELRYTVTPTGVWCQYSNDSIRSGRLPSVFLCWDQCRDFLRVDSPLADLWNNPSADHPQCFQPK